MKRYTSSPLYANQADKNKKSISKAVQYRINLKRKHQNILKAALSEKNRVVKVEAKGNYIRVYFSDKTDKFCYSSFKAACKLLPGKLFYQPICGTLVNLAHWEGFEKCGIAIFILLINDHKAKLSRESVRNLCSLTLYLSSNEYIRARKRQMV